MARNVSLFITNWTDVGTTVPFPRYDVDLRVEYTDNAGDPQVWEGTVNIPNDFNLVPVPWLRDELEDLIIRVTRKRLGIE